MTEPKHTDAQIEDMARDCMPWMQGQATAMLRSLLSERQAAMQGQGGEVFTVPVAFRFLGPNGEAVTEWEDAPITNKKFPSLGPPIESVQYAYLHPSAQPAQEQPGWKWVPVEPTVAMLEAALKLQGDDAFLASAPAVLSAFVKIYKAMLAASPTPPKEK